MTRIVRLALLCALALVAGPLVSQAQVTTINVNNSVIQSPVQQFGINLGPTNYYDSGQMLKNLIVNNPGFEGEIAQSMIQCESGTATSCMHANNYSGWANDFWDGASYQFIYGTALGRSGTVSTFTAANGYTGGNFNFADSGTVPAFQDYMIVKKAIPGNATDGWQVNAGGNSSATTNSTDLPPDETGIQTVELNAPTANDSITIATYFDSTAGRTFLQLNGTYQLTFEAKGLTPNASIGVNLFRYTNPATTYINNQIVPLSNTWQTYTITFNANETGTTVGTAELQLYTLSTAGGDAFYLDNVQLVQTNTDPTNTTIFRDPVVNTLKALHPGILRWWYNQLGEPLDNILAPPLGRQRSTFSSYTTDSNFVEYGLTDFLQLAQNIGADPWIVMPITLSDAEASNLIDYLAGPTTTVYGAKRAAAGQTAPWTSVFHTIHLEFGDEAWNGGLNGGDMEVPQAYGTRAQAVFADIRSNPNFVKSSFDLSINEQSAYPYNGTISQEHCNNNDSMTGAPYLMFNVNDPAASGYTGTAAINENLFGSLLAEPEAFVTASGNAENLSNGYVLQDIAAIRAGGSNAPYESAELNTTPHGGSITQAELNGYSSSLGAGLAVSDELFQNLRIGVLVQNTYSLGGWEYIRPDGSSVYEFGMTVDMGVTNLKRPQYLAEQLANSAIGSNSALMLQTVQTGTNPTWNQTATNQNVQLNNVHYLDSFAFQNGNQYSLVLYNLSRSTAYPVTFAGTNVPGGTVQMTQLTSANITDTNENSNVVVPVTSTLNSFNPAAQFSLPPYSMTTLTWTAPLIGGIKVSNVTQTSATISWTTDVAASGQVSYGTSTSYGTLSPLSAASTTQSVTLTGLIPGATYDFSILAANAAGAKSSSANATFTTTAAFNLSAPSTITLTQAQGNTWPVTITDIGGFSGSVSLALAPLPTGVTDAFTNTSNTGSTLVLYAQSTTTPGIYPMTLTGTSGASISTFPITLIVTGPQTITFGTVAAQALGTPLTLTATASSGLPVSYASSTTSVCTVSGNTVSFLATGTCTITASQAGNAAYTAAKAVTQSFTVNREPQTITFTPPSAMALNSILTVTATASSGLPVTFSVVPNGNCSVSNGNQVTFLNYGNCGILADQAGNSTFAAAPENGQIVVVNQPTAQTITFGTVAAQNVGTPLTLTATASSGLAVSYASSTTSICTVAGNTATFLAKGTCTLTASQNGNATYSAAKPVSQSFTVNLVLTSQTITFGTIAAQTVGTPLTLSATATSGLAVTFASSTPATCTASGTTATFLAGGTCTIVASQAGNTTYAAATPVSQSFTVNPAAQTITFNAPAAQSVGTPLALSASATSGLAVSFVSSTTGVCTVSGSTASFVGAGNCTITASQAGNGSYAAATPVSQTFTVNPGAQTITFAAVPAQTVGATLTLSATATSGLPVSYTSSASATVCTVSGSTVSFAGTGTCTVTASQAGNANYNPAAPVTQNIAVNPALTSQTISFGTVAAQTVGTPLTLGATASSGLAVSYAASPSSVCAVSGSTASFSGAGTCTITASQAGNGTYAAATPVSQSFTVNLAPQTISFGTVAAQTVGTPLTLSATASSGLAVSYAASPSSVCAVTGSTASFSGAGTCTITASQAGNSTYAAATPVSQSFTVNASTALKSQTITFTPPSAMALNSILTVTATASSGLPVTFSLVPNGNCSIANGNQVTFLNYGNCGILANQAGNSTYAAAPQNGQIVVVNQPTAQTISFGTIAAQTVGTPLTLSATASSGLAVSYASSTTGVCTVSGSTATFLAAGTCTLTASQNGNATYSAAKTVSQSFTVNAAALKSQTITFNPLPSENVGATLTVSATASSGLPVTFVIVQNGNCSISGNVVTMLNSGNCGVIATQPGNSTYAAAPAVGQIIVIP